MKIFKSRWMTALLLFAVIALSANLGAVARADAGVEPATFSATLNPGESASFDLSAITGAKPIPSIDVTFAIDCTNSMEESITAVKAKALEVMDSIRALVPDSYFGLVHFMDYPASYVYPGYSNQYGDSAYGDVPYHVDLPITSDIGAVAAGITGLVEGYGADWPQNYTRVLYELQGGTPESGGMISWRTTSKKLVIMFGDAPAHDLNFADANFGGDPGRDGIAMTADDLDFETVVGQLKAMNISVLAIDCDQYTDESAATFQGMSVGFATAPGTNGQYFRLADTGQIPEAVLGMIQAEVSTINHLTLGVPVEFANWVGFTPQEYTGVGPNTTDTFAVTVTVPPGTPPGVYTFPINAVGDGAFLGATQVSVTVPSHPSLSLAKTAEKSTYEVGNTAKYTLTVKNTGDVALHNVTVNDPNLTWDGSNTTGTLAVGASKDFTGKYVVTEADWRNGGKHVNNATATSTEGASGQATCTVTVTGTPAMTLTKTAEKSTYEVGNTAKYTLTVKNTGDVALHNVTVNDPNLTWDGSNTTGTLAVGASKDFTGKYVVTEADWRNGGKHVNNATATSTEGASGQASCTVTVSLPKGCACGSGNLCGDSSKRFSFDASDKVCNPDQPGHLCFSDQDKQCNAIEIVSKGCTYTHPPENPNRADVSGSCSYNGKTGYTFRLSVEDKSDSRVQDSFALTMYDSRGSVVYQHQDTASGNEIKVCH